MSVRREVVTLSQLLRRNDNSNSRRGTGRAPPLPLQTSRRRVETPHREGRRQVHSAPLSERPASSGSQPLSFTQSVLDASRVSTSQSEHGASSQMSNGFPVLSQEVHEAESEQLSAMTSMSQSSFSQSQNLLGSSQDGQLDRFQQWQSQQAPPLARSASIRCDGSEKLREVEQTLTKAFVEQTHKQTEQQLEILTRVIGPIKKSIEDIEAKLATSSVGQQKQIADIENFAKEVDGVVSSVTELRQQNVTFKAICEETQTSVINDSVAMKAVLTGLQARIEVVETSINSCSGLVAQLLEAEPTKHEALLSAITASSCNYPNEYTPDEDPSGDGQTSRKRRRSAHRHDVNEVKRTCYTSFPSTEEPYSRTRTRSPHRYEFRNNNTWRDYDDEETDGLHHALNRIEALRAKRRSYQLSFSDESP